MLNPIDYEYFQWLTSQIDIRSSRTYNDLFMRLHDTEFLWTVPNDDNRVQDGLDLRNEFINDVVINISRREIEKFKSRMLKGATLLEILISLSRRVAFTAGGFPEWWAWQLIQNLRLHKQSDPFNDQKARYVDGVLENLIWRTYQKDGRGGFFPLNFASEDDDQTKVEIWYQMNKYVMEIQEP